MQPTDKITCLETLAITDNYKMLGFAAGHYTEKLTTVLKNNFIRGKYNLPILVKQLLLMVLTKDHNEEHEKLHP